MLAELASIQREFTRGLLDIDAVDAVLPFFKGDQGRNRERFFHYRGNAVATWQKTCEGTFPVLQRLVGELFFAELSRQYGLAYGSQSGDLAEFGAAMPEFIAGLEQCRGYPFLADVAALEWQVHRSYHAALLAPVTMAELASQPPEQLMETRYALQPACSLLSSPWAVAEIWLAQQAPEGNLPEQIDQASHCLVWRQAGSWEVRVAGLTAATDAALRTLQSRGTLGEALEAALAIDPDFAVLAETGEWLQRQLLAFRSSNQEFI